MGVEIERKFLVDENKVPEGAYEIPIIQAYLCAEKERTVRIRKAGNKAFITIKGKMTGFSRSEFEYEIPVKDAEAMIPMAVNFPVEKVRRIVYNGENKWEVDFFKGLNQGLVVAELELSDENETFDLPDWIVKEVTGCVDYQNSRLAAHPYSKWKKY